MSQITATARTLSRAFSRVTRAAQAGQAIYARAWFREPRRKRLSQDYKTNISVIVKKGFRHYWGLVSKPQFSFEFS